jgi:hypothetical protein
MVWVSLLLACSDTVTLGQVCDRLVSARCLAADVCSGQNQADACYDEGMRSCCSRDGCDTAAAVSGEDLDRCVAAIAQAACDEEVPSCSTLGW